MFSGASSSSTTKRLLHSSLVSAISSNIRSTRAHANSLEDEQEIADVKKGLESMESKAKVLGNKAKHVGATGPEADARFRSAIAAGIPRQLALEQLRKRRRVALFRKRGVPVRAEARRRLESEWFAEFGYAPRRRRRLCDEEGIENLPTEVVTVDDNEVIINIRECSGVLHSRGLNKQMERAPLSKKELAFGLQFPDDDTTLFEKTRTVRKTKGPHEKRKSMACIKRRRAARLQRMKQQPELYVCRMWRRHARCVRGSRCHMKHGQPEPKNGYRFHHCHRH